MADDDKHWQNMSPDEQAIVIRQINGAVNGLQFRVQDLEDAVKAEGWRGAPALADDRTAHAQGLDMPKGNRRQAHRGLLAFAPGADGRDARERSPCAHSRTMDEELPTRRAIRRERPAAQRSRRSRDVASEDRTDRDRLRGWACRTRSQKCRRKISL